MKRSIRLDSELIKQAETIGSRSKRSIASQVEYWAGLGRALEKSQQPTKEQLSDLLSFNSTFIEKVGEEVGSGEFERNVLQGGYAFEKSKMGSGYVDKVFQDGVRLTGRIIDGNFVEIPLNSTGK